MTLGSRCGTTTTPPPGDRGRASSRSTSVNRPSTWPTRSFREVGRRRAAALASTEEEFAQALRHFAARAREQGAELLELQSLVASQSFDETGNRRPTDGNDQA